LRRSLSGREELRDSRTTLCLLPRVIPVVSDLPVV